MGRLRKKPYLKVELEQYNDYKCATIFLLKGSISYGSPSHWEKIAEAGLCGDGRSWDFYFYDFIKIKRDRWTKYKSLAHVARAIERYLLKNGVECE